MLLWEMFSYGEQPWHGLTGLEVGGGMCCLEALGVWFGGFGGVVWWPWGVVRWL